MGTLGMVGLGKMGGNMAERLRRGGHTSSATTAPRTAGRDVASLEELVQQLPAPRVVWVMVPAGDPTYQTVDALAALLERATSSSTAATPLHRRPAARATSSPKGIGFVDCGVSGGVWGLTEGYALMCGGSRRMSRRCSRSSTSSSPRATAASCTPARSGAGHFAKMVTTASSTA
jgi:6-phosphogluconate dehydrogenase